MLITRRLLLPTLSLLLLPAAVQAQGSGTTLPRGVSFGNSDPYTVTYSFKGQLQQIDRDAGLFLMVDEKSEERIVFQVGERTRYRADKQVLGKKKISWSELAVGQRIQVRARVLYEESTSGDENADMTITVQEVKVLKPKKA